MFAISFDLTVSILEEVYGTPYNNAYYEVKSLLKADGFEWIQGSTYLTPSNDLSTVLRAIMHLKQIDWFVKSVRDIRGYRVEDWSDFTDLVKNG
ncbi:MAG: virulence protein [Bacteroidaceae bacterium]|nr:virulence protein [Bacteroidaceae bacterium]